MKRAIKNNKNRKFLRILVANRGEIAVRVIRAIQELGMEAVAVYSEVDEGAMHTRLADKRIALKGNSAKDSYLNSEKIINAAIQSGADAIHPGYGFFSENAEFAKKVIENKICFIGPSPKTISLMGDKNVARQIAIKAKVPVVPGTQAGLDIKELIKFASKVNYPVLIKAIAGGSGRGMRVVNSENEFLQKIQEAQTEAEAAFGNKEIIVEKYLKNPRHIEVQVFADSYGKVIHLFERDCSLQRRHQKILEEAPAPNLNPKLRERILKAAVKLTKAVEYSGAGTLEFLVENPKLAKSGFYFLEMNTRIQVEHTVTEEITGIDLVKEQILVAAGQPLQYSQKDIKVSGHAIQFRVYGENPANNFSPCTGKITYISRPGGIGVREDTWVEAGSKLSPHYDALLSKLIIKAPTRELAIARAKAYLQHYNIEGLDNTLTFHRWVMEQPDFLEANYFTKWIESNYQGEAIYAKSTGPLKVEIPHEKL